MVVVFTVSCRDHFNPRSVHCYEVGNSLVVCSSTPERELRNAIATWNSNGKFKNSECNCLCYNLTGSLTLPFYYIFSNLSCCESFMFHPKCKNNFSNVALPCCLCWWLLEPWGQAFSSWIWSTLFKCQHSEIIFSSLLHIHYKRKNDRFTHKVVWEVGTERATWI